MLYVTWAYSNGAVIGTQQIYALQSVRNHKQGQRTTHHRRSKRTHLDHHLTVFLAKGAAPRPTIVACITKSLSYRSMFIHHMMSVSPSITAVRTRTNCTRPFNIKTRQWCYLRTVAAPSVNGAAEVGIILTYDPSNVARIAADESLGNGLDLWNHLNSKSSEQGHKTSKMKTHHRYRIGCSVKTSYQYCPIFILS